MDDNLRKRLERIEAQIGVVYEAEEKFLSLEAAEDHLRATLVSKAEGNSQAARQTNAEATPEWLEFQRGVAIARAVFHREKHTLDLKLKAFDAEYLTLKVEAQAITRQK